MDRTGKPVGQIFKELSKAREKDVDLSAGRVFNSMYTRPLSISKKAHMMFIESNLGNPGLFPGTQKLERDVISMLGALLHNKNAAGHIVGGGTEANITAIWIAKSRNTSAKKVIMPKSAHFSFEKAVQMMDLEPVEIGLDENYRADVGELEDAIQGGGIAAAIGIAGTTALGVIDPIADMAELCRKEGVFLHVDAAFGGFVIPFLKDLGYSVPDFDFSIKGVSSITIDPHKMGLSTFPAGALLVRSKDYLSSISVKTPYLTVEHQTTISGTRCSASVASTWAAMNFMGRAGYRGVVKQCMDNTHYLERRLGEAGLRLAAKPTMNVIGVLVRRPKNIVKAMGTKGWKIGKLDEPRCIRLVVMPHNTRKVIDEFVRDFRAECRKAGEA